MSMKSKLENFWYHYKLRVIIFSGFAVILAVCLIQIMGRTDYDLFAIYAGEADINIVSEKTGEVPYKTLENSVRQISGKRDYKTSIQCYTYVPSAIAAEYEKKGINYNLSKNNETKKAFISKLVDGKCTVLLLTPELYTEAKGLDTVSLLSDVLGYTPEYSSDGYCVKLADTSFYKFFGAMSAFPEDTLLCFRNQKSPSAMVGSDDKEAYERQKEIFQKIIEFDK